MNKQYCPEHPGSMINPKYGKCWVCAKRDGDLILCKECGVNWHDKDFATCYPCSHSTKQEPAGVVETDIPF
jgi:hypothetical protein